MGIKANGEKSVVIHFRRKLCAKSDQFPSEMRPSLWLPNTSIYMGCAIDEYLDLNAMVDDRAEAGRRALGSLLWGELIVTKKALASWVRTSLVSSSCFSAS